MLRRETFCILCTVYALISSLTLAAFVAMHGNQQHSLKADSPGDFAAIVSEEVFSYQQHSQKGARFCGTRTTISPLLFSGHAFLRNRVLRIVSPFLESHLSLKKAVNICYSRDSCIPKVFMFSLLTTRTFFGDRIRSEQAGRLEYKKIVVNYPTWELGKELGSYERAASVLN